MVVVLGKCEIVFKLLAIHCFCDVDPYAHAQNRLFQHFHPENCFAGRQPWQEDCFR